MLWKWCADRTDLDEVFKSSTGLSTPQSRAVIHQLLRLKHATECLSGWMPVWIRTLQDLWQNNRSGAPVSTSQVDAVKKPCVVNIRLLRRSNKHLRQILNSLEIAIFIRFIMTFFPQLLQTLRCHVLWFLSWTTAWDTQGWCNVMKDLFRFHIKGLHKSWGVKTAKSLILWLSASPVLSQPCSEFDTERTLIQAEDNL